ncbi:IS21 family transposase [Arcobacter porcinus]|uniref:Integrase core domain protein n=1 Tax=Arcobacter porcinus TaxID=1935204 RepID=A0ABX2YAR1_9BACT|nr:IS21 family transposase [Arcobacter porcinus]OCL90823.1 Integrase core domain protein [Arcobacter porcinus]
MIDKEEFIVIHTLHKRGYSIRAISKIVGLDRRTISKRLQEKDLKPYKKIEYKSKLDLFKDYIIERVNQATPDKIPSTVIYEEIKKYGYDEKIRTLQTFLSTLKNNVKAEDIIRFETKPSYQAQVDWTIIRSGKSPIYGFVMVLGFSRMAFVYFTDNMRQTTWQDCHVKAFEYFGGVPQTLLYDNLKSVVIQRDKYGKNQHGFNNDFLEFAKDNFIPKLCKVYRAKTKGKVERFNHYLKNNFYIPLKASLKNSSIAIDSTLLNSKIFSWLEYANSRVHDTTKKKPIDMFKDEKPLLQPFYSSVKEIKDNKETKIINSSIDLSKLNMDIKYHTTISDYEKVLGVSYVGA